jgi:aconitate hydratase
MASSNPFDSKDRLETQGGELAYHRLSALSDEGLTDLDRLPVTVKILLENLIRMAVGGFASDDDIERLAGWADGEGSDAEFPFAPSRVILQDFTGVPSTVDLAAMRSAIQREGGDPSQVDPRVPVDLVIDHSVQVDRFATSKAFAFNVEREYERNSERYQLLKWAQGAFNGFRVVPPGMGIVHQVNLEYLGRVVTEIEIDGEKVAIPDTLVGTDSHTPMINGLGVLGWGVGGIEAEAALLGQPIPLLTPKVVGFKFTGSLPEGVTATDLVLTVTEILREHGVVGKFVEFYGAGLSSLGVADRATLSNMSPEFGATASLFPPDEQTLQYLRLTGRDEELIGLVESYTKAQKMFRTDDTPDPTFTEALELDLSTVEPSLAGPKRPQDRVTLANASRSFTDAFSSDRKVTISAGREDEPTEEVEIGDGSVVIAAITSCTNTSNPSVMLAAGLLAKNAVSKGLTSKPWVKTSLAPGSRVVTDYLEGADLIPYLEKLGFYTVGYGCTTCIGNSGPLPESVSKAVEEEDLSVVSVLSGNRNFEGRIHPQVRASYLASPPLVVAYSLAGTIEIDLTTDPIGTTESGEDVYLKDIWPSTKDVAGALDAVTSDLFIKEYASIFDGDERWRQLPAPTGDLFEWDESSTYVKEPPFFRDLGAEPEELDDIEGARVLVMVGDSVTTDHISPAGSFPPQSPAGRYLKENGVEPQDFNSYGSRRGNHEVMMRGTFANIRLRNELVESEGGFTRKLPDGDETTIFEAAMAYAQDGIPLIGLAGKEYGSGSSRDWAAKGPALLGMRALIAESFERIHRSNLIGMGVLPLQFPQGEDRSSLGLSGEESYDVRGIAEGLKPGGTVQVTATDGDGNEITFEALVRIDNEVELDYYRHGGVLHMVLRKMIAGSG